MTGTDPRARAMARHARNREGDCVECSVGVEYGGIPWPCNTWLDLETDQERARREAADAKTRRDAETYALTALYRRHVKAAETARAQAAQREKDRAKTAARLVDLLDGDVPQVARLLGITEVHVRNHQADAAGVLHGMASPGGSDG